MPRKNISDEHQELYHYTSTAGLNGILENQSLWATHYAFLNDSEEIIRAKRILLEYFQPVAWEFVQNIYDTQASMQQFINTKGGVEKIAREQLIKFIDSFYKSILGDEKRSGLAECFVVSLCSHKHIYEQKNGLLSQWRGYGRDGGYAIVFKACDIEKFIEHEEQRFSYVCDISLSEVFYDDEEKKFPESAAHNLQEDLNIFKDALHKFFQYYVDNHKMDHTLFNQAFPSFFRCISGIKNYGFREEGEIRIAALAIKHTPEFIKELTKTGEKLPSEKPIEFREQSGLKIPYINLFSFNKEEQTKLPISRIIVGPHKDRDLRRKSLELRLKGTGIDVVSSQLPYIN